MLRSSRCLVVLVSIAAVAGCAREVRDEIALLRRSVFADEVALVKDPFFGRDLVFDFGDRREAVRVEPGELQVGELRRERERIVAVLDGSIAGRSGFEDLSELEGEAWAEGYRRGRWIRHYASVEEESIAPAAAEARMAR
ncbi:MAG TPA: hypothetical protein VK116_18870 [Planctomycetota bacterium]|nr:hypothetical protein [Planctomycetota bacterium]